MAGAALVAVQADPAGHELVQGGTEEFLQGGLAVLLGGDFAVDGARGRGDAALFGEGRESFFSLRYRQCRLYPRLGT
jgi:hypothetical protein